eukprot:gene31317-40691_t
MIEQQGLNPLQRLKDTLEVAQKNTEKILTKLQRFESHLTDLDHQLRPIEESTAGYIVAKQNISNTLLEVGKTFEYFKIATEVKDTINGGLNADTQREVFEALGRLSDAKTFFETHREIKSASSVLSTIEIYLSKAVSECVVHFEKLLQTSDKSVEIIDGRFEMLNPITDEVAGEIKAICDVLEQHKHTAHFKTYQTVRITKLKAELKEVEQSNPTSWTHLLQDGPYEKGKYPFSEFFTLTFHLLRSENQLWASTLPNSEESLYVFVTICESLIHELQNIVSPFLSEDGGKSRSSTNSQLFLIRLDILDTLLNEFERMRESKASTALLSIKKSVVQASLQTVINLISNTYVESFSPDKKTNSDTFNESLSCDLHPVTGNILHCCKEMMGWTMNAHGMHEMEDKVAEDFILSARKHLFMANNLFAMFMFVKDRKREAGYETSGHPTPTSDRRTSLNTVLVTGTASKPVINKAKQIIIIVDRIESRLKQEQVAFCDRIAAVMGLTATEMAEFKGILEKDKSGHGRALKAKFTLFNTGLREHMSAQLLEAILPVYTEFFNTYASVKFSKKHMNEYLRFQPAQVERNLKTFFGRS